MKKFILSTIAVAAFTVGGAAQADLIDSVGYGISRILGVPYDPQLPHPGPVAQYGSYRDQWGRTVYLGPDRQPAYVEDNGRLVPYGGVTGNYAVGPAHDVDGDGVPNQYDRSPQDPRYR
jgi:hypothetical protein